jgi:hemolysin III
MFSDAANPQEERANFITHLVGAALAMLAGVPLIVFTAQRGDPFAVVGVCIFVLTLFLLFLASTIYHGVPAGKNKYRLEILDHSAIYLLIAGTYTPFTLVTLRGAWGWSRFGVVWGMAILGVIFKAYFTGKFKFISTLMYVLMGWLIVIAINPLKANMLGTGMFWLVLGGLFYTVGTYFYMNKRMPFAHSIWHVFVLLGAVSHFICVWTQMVR